MDICGEHGEEIAYMGRDCPACEHVERIQADYKEELNTLEEDLQADIDSLQEQLDAKESE